MVTKQQFYQRNGPFRSVLAKIFMVTKLINTVNPKSSSSVLAKIFMVTKPSFPSVSSSVGSVLAKIFMVTKRF